MLPRPAKRLPLCVNLNLLPRPAKQPSLDRVVACEFLPIAGLNFLKPTSPHKLPSPPPGLSLPSLPPLSLMYSHPQGFWVFKTNDLRWQQSVKASVGQQIPLITSNTELLQKGRKVSPSRHTHPRSRFWQLASWCRRGRGSYRALLSWAIIHQEK